MSRRPAPSGMAGLLGVALLAAPGCSRAPAALFTDITASSGIRFQHENGARGKRHLPETTVGGLAWIDVDSDCRQDLYLVNGNLNSARGGAGDAGDRLFRNRGGGQFDDITAAAGVGDGGYGSGAAVGDFDNDGRSDLYVTNHGPNILYHNLGGGRFRDVAAAAGVAGGGWSSSAAFLDHDLDGDLDLYVCRYLDYDPSRKCMQGGVETYCSPQLFSGVPDLLYRNDGGGAFTDVSAAAGVAIAGPGAGKSLGVVVLDSDDDGDPDIFVACDQVPNLFFTNNRDGTFTECALLVNVAYSADGLARAGMGVDAGDIDLDGREDIVVTNFADEANSLFRAAGGGQFNEEGKRFDLAALSLGPLGFGILLTDFDLDSDLDLYVANGHVQDNIALVQPDKTFAQSDQLLDNIAGKRFADASARGGEWFRRKLVSRSAATADHDGDGDEDIAILTSGGPAVLLRNDAPPSHWIGLRLQGTRSNRDAYGAKVRVDARRAAVAFSRRFEVRSARSYASACDPGLRVGLGADPVAVERVEIRWPSGTLQVLQAPAIDSVHLVVEAPSP